jgi:general stress protein YciG
MNTGNKNQGYERDKSSSGDKKGGQSGSGNFANDREKASEAGRKGGQQSHSGGRKS